MKYQAAIFDLDGTLLDTLEDLADSMNAALAEHGLPGHNLEKFRYLVGEGVLSLVANAMPEDRRDPELAEKVAKSYLAIYEQNWHAKTLPYPGIMDTILALRESGVPLTVLSNKPQTFTELCVNHFFPADTFQIVFGQRSHVPRKPDPAGAFEIAEKLGISPKVIAFIGDTKTDICTSVAAGMTAIGVSWGFRPVSELREFGAAHIIDHPGELLPFFAEPVLSPI